MNSKQNNVKQNNLLTAMKRLGTKNLVKIGGGSLGIAVAATALLPFLERL